MQTKASTEVAIWLCTLAGKRGQVLFDIDKISSTILGFAALKLDFWYSSIGILSIYVLYQSLNSAAMIYIVRSMNNGQSVTKEDLIEKVDVFRTRLIFLSLVACGIVICFWRLIIVGDFHIGWGWIIIPLSILIGSMLASRVGLCIRKRISKGGGGPIMGPLLRAWYIFDSGTIAGSARKGLLSSLIIQLAVVLALLNKMITYLLNAAG